MDVLEDKERREAVSPEIVRRELADQIRRHRRPNLVLAEKLEKVAGSMKPEVVFSRGTWPDIKVELAGEEVAEEIGIQYLETIRRKVEEIVEKSRLGSREFQTRKGKTVYELTIGERLLHKKLDHWIAAGSSYPCSFAGIQPTQGNAEEIIISIMQEDTSTVIVRDRVVNIFNSRGQGLTIIIESGEWLLEKFDDSASFIGPRNLLNKKL